MAQLGLRAEHVGSLVRPEGLAAATFAAAGGVGDPAQLRAIQDEVIIESMKRQVESGMRVISDGEARRFVYLDPIMTIFRPEAFDFTRGLELPWHGDPGQEVPEIMSGAKTSLVVGRLERSGVHMAEREAEFLLGHIDDLGIADPVSKVTLPSPSHVGLLSWSPESDAYYPTRADLITEVAAALADEARLLAERGVNYVQVDDPVLHWFCDPSLTERMRQWGVDPDELLGHVLRADNLILDAASEGGAVTGLHICFGNSMGLRIADGSYEPIARVLAESACDRLLLEYSDQAISGGFEPLRHVAPDKTVVLGLVSTRRPALEQPDDLIGQIEAASRYIPLDRLAISTQCGFATIVHGNPLSIDEQYLKLRLVADVAADVWR